MRVLVTGARGFVGTNLREALAARGGHEVIEVTRADDRGSRGTKLARADFVFHLAGANRVRDEREFRATNAELTEQLCADLRATGRATPVLLASSLRAANPDDAYGASKLEAESVVADYARTEDAAVWLYRLPNLFGPWGRPNYNSVVATFCYNVSRSLPIEVHDPAKLLGLTYVVDAVGDMMQTLASTADKRVHQVDVGPVHPISLTELAATIRAFPMVRGDAGTVSEDGQPAALVAKLHATYRWYVKCGHVFDA